MLTPELEASARRFADILLAELENTSVSPEATNKSFAGESYKLPDGEEKLIKSDNLLEGKRILFPL